MWYHFLNFAVSRNKILFGPKDFCNVKMSLPLLMLGNESYSVLRSRACSWLKCLIVSRPSVTLKAVVSFILIKSRKKSCILSFFLLSWFNYANQHFLVFFWACEMLGIKFLPCCFHLFGINFVQVFAYINSVLWKIWINRACWNLCLLKANLYP